MKKLDEIRDELAGKACVHFIAVDAYKEGWDAAMERVEPLVEVVTENINHHEYCQFRYRDKCECTAALINEALAKFRGEEE